MLQWEKNNSIITSSTELIAALRSVKGFKVTGITIPTFPGGRPNINTMDGCCKWYYSYSFPKLGLIHAYEVGNDAVYGNTHSVPNKIFRKHKKTTDVFAFLWLE